MESIGTSYEFFGTTACVSLAIHSELSLMLRPYNDPGMHCPFRFTHEHSPFSMWDVIAMLVPRIKLTAINLPPDRAEFAESRFYLLFQSINVNGASSPVKFILKKPLSTHFLLSSP